MVCLCSSLVLYTMSPSSPHVASILLTGLIVPVKMFCWCTSRCPKSIRYPVESMSEPSIQESLEWSGKLEDIMFELAKSDFACITTATPLKKFSTLATSTTSQGSESGAICGYPMIVPSPIITDNLKTFLLDGKASFRLDSKTKTPALYVETRDFPGIPLISMVCLNQKSQVIGICVKEEPVQGVGDPKRCQISGIEVFWK